MTKIKHNESKKKIRNLSSLKQAGERERETGRGREKRRERIQIRVRTRTQEHILGFLGPSDKARIINDFYVDFTQ